MPPGQGSKFAALATPDGDDNAGGSTKLNKKAKQKAKNKNKQQQQAALSSTDKAQQQQPKKSAPTNDGDNPKETLKPSSQSSKSSVVAASTSKQSKSKSPDKVVRPSAPKEAVPKSSSTTTSGTCPYSRDSAVPSSASSSIQSLFIWSVSACYLFAFISFYYQIRGLYGDNGVLPLQHYAASLAPKNQTIGPDGLYQATGSWVWLLPKFGFTLTSSLELLTLAGVLVSFGQLLFGSFRCFPNYVFLFVLYYSIARIGQTFLHFQWDVFLLEVGALTTLASIRGRYAPDPHLMLWPIRWLLFRFMFSNGVVKLTSRCPLWWSLRTLDVHFESQCIPTPLAWYAHQLPQNWLHLAVVVTYVIEIVGPFLFFVPFKSVKKFSFASQLLLQLSIIATGNFNFFNLLTIALCLSLLDCGEITTTTSCPRSSQQGQKEKSRKELYLNGILYGVLGYFVVHYFAVHFDNVTDLKSVLTVGPSSKINFTYEDFNVFLGYAITVAIWLGVVSLTHFATRALLRSLYHETFFARTLKFANTIAVIIVCGAILAVSIVPLAELDTSGQYLRRIPAPLKRWYATAQDAGVVSSYGLFRVMTGEGGRPELIIEGTNDPNNEPWQQYHFRYKPGDVNVAPRFNIPHQPRLDWQMWFAALGTYQANQWLLNLSYRLLTSEPEVLNLLDTARLPFPVNAPPKYLRISRYLYKFTDNHSNAAWWTQTNNRHAYLPVINKDTLAAALKLEEIAVPSWIQSLSKTESSQHPTIKLVLDQLYQTLVVRYSTQLEPHLLSILLFSLAFLVQWSRCKKGTTAPASAS